MKTHLTACAFLVLTVDGQPLLAEEAAHNDDHPPLAGAVEAFHDVLRVDWHGEIGPARNLGTCEHTGQYITIARQITAEAGPAHADADDWKVASNGLLDASVALGAYCASGMDANVEAGLSTVHDRFHDLMKLMKAPA